jgi:nitric oxide reductase subunit B
MNPVEPDAGRIRRWAAVLAVGLVTSFSVLLYFGAGIHQAAPPIPERVTTREGATLFTRADIETGQDVWRSIGGHELGSVWGHGAYVAPDWTADWLHREALWLLDRWAGGAPATRSSGSDPVRRYADLDPATQAALRVRLQDELRTNTYEPSRGELVVSADRAAAIAAVAAHFKGLFRHEEALDGLRTAYAMPRDTVGDDARADSLNAFFFWATWACVTNRPGEAVTYTQNWPPDELVANRPTGAIVVVSVASFVLLLGGIGALFWYRAATSERDAAEAVSPPARDPLFDLAPTPSMKATLKYFWIVGALLVAQMTMGIVVAHFGVEGAGFYGLPLGEWLPYSLARTWHGQLGIFWIATSWLATGLLLAPAIGGGEPRFQRLGVNLLFAALLVIVAGSMIGQFFAIHQRLGHDLNYWLGHQGYEYIDLGRFWQIFLLVGLVLWLGLMGRALLPALRRRRGAGDDPLLLLFVLSAAAIPTFYAAGLFAGRHTNLAVAEYWRWWVVHLWVEGFFEIFATVVIAFLFARLGLVRVRAATAAVLFSAALYMLGGVLGMFHHLYFTGTPTAVLALGGTFSALEIMPLVAIGQEGYRNRRMIDAVGWMRAYRWPLSFFVAVAFWNLVGAGLFGFLINPPIALYYMQGLNTTPVHSHTALFGVYGLLGIGLTLFSLRLLTSRVEWDERFLAVGFWASNVGLGLMVLLSLLPIGLLQTWASVEHGMAYARSAEFLQSPLLEKLRWMRMIGDVVFAVGILAIGWFVVGLTLGWSRKGPRTES